jgi:hypothetical protein
VYNKVRELATVCLPWQQWTETSVSFDDIGVLAFHSCVVVDLRQWCLLLSANNLWILHHDNAPAHMALSVREFLASKQITVLEHPPCPPDLAPSQFYLFPKIKKILKGRRFGDIDDIRSIMMAALKAISQNQFQNCFEGRTRHLQGCIASQGKYSEGNHIDIQQ